MATSASNSNLTDAKYGLDELVIETMGIKIYFFVRVLDELDGSVKFKFPGLQEGFSYSIRIWQLLKFWNRQI